tara:strand:- start:22342 stop:25755 length:3414 start_codon:yes stop_codon:yes gene_type:complete
MKIKLDKIPFFLRKELMKIIMKFFVFICCISTFGFTPNALLSQNPNIKIDSNKTIKVEEVFDLIMDQTDYKFIYQEGIFKDFPKVSVKKGIIKSNTLLNKILSWENFTIVVTKNKTVLVKEKAIVKETTTKEESQQLVVSGTVVDQNGQPLPGANIIEKGTDNGVQTDFDGNFKLNVSDKNAILVISFIGFLPQEVEVNNRTSIKVTLIESETSLDEVVIIGYGTVSKRDLTGSVSSFDSKAIDRQPSATDLSELMRGSLPGLNVGTSTNAAGSSNLLVRGINSLAANNEPLLVVDDVIYQGSLSSINPADIASISVLKDASAAAVYGSRAASGVVIVTTKKGTTGKPIINVRSSVGFATAGFIEEVYGPGEFFDYKTAVFDQMTPKQLGYYNNPNNLPDGVSLNDWLDYDGLGGTSTDPADIWLDRLQLSDPEKTNYKNGKTLDWKDIIFQNGIRTNNTVSVSGKTDNVSYYGSLNYVDNTGILLFQKNNALRGRLNLETKINNFISAGINMQTASIKQPTGLPDQLYSYENQSPFGSLYYDDGSIKHNPNDDSLLSNPFLWTYHDNYYRQNEYFTNIYAKATLPFGFSYQVRWSNRAATTQDYRFRPAIASLGDGGANGSRRTVWEKRYNIDNIINWKKSFGNHNFDLTLLYNVEDGKTFVDAQSNSDFSPNDVLSYHNLAIGINPVISNNDTHFTADAMMARLSYNFLNRYYITGTIRRDGNSAFGKSNPYANFPALSFAWRLSDESFLSNADFINDLKLNVSWGKNGNSDIGLYSALSQLGDVNYIYDGATVTGIRATDLANSDLKWESTESYNAFLEFSLFNSRLSGKLEYYQSSTSDLLLQRTLPILTGYGNVFANLGEVENKGVEISLSTENIRNNNFSWNSSFIFTHNKNTIKHLYGDMVDVLDDEGNVIGQREEDDIANDWYIGRGVRDIFDYRITGVWQLGEEDEAAVFGRVPGDLKIADINDDGVIDFDDKVFQGSRLPNYRVSLRNDFTYKNFDLSIFTNALLDFKGGNNEHFNFRTQQQRLNKIKTPYWTPDNPLNDWARLSSKNSSPNTTWWEDRSFIRIQNITLGYNFPKDFLERLKIKSFRIYGNVQNLPAIPLKGWKYNWDAETGRPTPLITAFGIDLSL